MSYIHASVAQCGTVHNDTQATLSKMRRLAMEAATGELPSQLIVFPEAFIGGYPKFSTFGASIGTRSDAGRREFVDYFKQAIECPGPATRHIEEIAHDCNIFIVTGFIERDGGTLYCSVGFFSPESGLVYKRRKLMPTASERLIWGFGDQTTVSVVDAQLLQPKHAENADFSEVAATSAKLSSAICWENMMPLLRTHFYSQGTQIHCAPTVDGRENWQSVVRTIALEGRCFVLSACQMNEADPYLSFIYFSRQAEFPVTHPVEGDRDPQGIMIAGGSVIISPLGEILAGPLRDKEGVLTARLNMDDIAAGKFDFDVVGHYARPDIFKLSVAA